MTTSSSNCQHFPKADDLCFVCPIVFDWKPLTSIPHTYACMIAGVAIGLYEQPSDKSHWITMTGPAGKPFPSEPKKFPNRSLAEAWAADILRLLFMAPQPETKLMTPTEPVDPNVPTNPQPKVETEQKPFEPPKDDEPNVPGPEFEPGDDEGDDEVEIEDDDEDVGDFD